jgi:hypothetical protein
MTIGGGYSSIDTDKNIGHPYGNPYPIRISPEPNIPKSAAAASPSTKQSVKDEEQH